MVLKENQELLVIQGKKAKLVQLAHKDRLETPPTVPQVEQVIKALKVLQVTQVIKVLKVLRVNLVM